MKSFEHMNFEKRKIIANNLSTRNASAKEIAGLIYVDPSAVSKEVKRNRYISMEAINKRDSIYKKTLRYPYVCNACVYRANNCLYRQYRYETSRAQSVATYKLIVPRRRINLSPEEFEILDKKIKDGIANNKSIYQIVTEDEEITVSVPTVYKYISDKILTTKRKAFFNSCLIPTRWCHPISYIFSCIHYIYLYASILDFFILSLFT